MTTPEWLTELHNDCAKADRHGDAVEWSTDSVRALLDLIEQLGTALFDAQHNGQCSYWNAPTTTDARDACSCGLFAALAAYRAGPDGRTT